MTHAFGKLDELGEGYGFRKIRAPLGVTAFGVNAIVMPPGYSGFHHYHDTQDELYFVHSGQARVEVEGEERLLGPGGLVHVESTTPRKVSNASEDEDLVMLVVGGKDGYVERDGHMVDDAGRRAARDLRTEPRAHRRELRRRRRGVRPLHGSVLGAARAAVPRLRARRERAGAGRRLRPGSAHSGARRALRGGRGRGGRSVRVSSSPPRASATPAFAWSSQPRRRCRSTTGSSRPRSRSSSFTS